MVRRVAGTRPVLSKRRAAAELVCNRASMACQSGRVQSDMHMPQTGLSSRLDKGSSGLSLGTEGVHGMALSLDVGEVEYMSGLIRRRLWVVESQARLAGSHRCAIDSSTG